jgi:hypothetical protein
MHKINMDVDFAGVDIFPKKPLFSIDAKTLNMVK